MVATTDDIFAKLPALTHDELRAVRARAGLLLPGGGIEPPATDGRGVSPDIALVHREIADVLAAAGLPTPPPPAVVLKGKGGKPFKEAAAAVCAYADANLRPTSKAERVAAVRLLVKLLARRVGGGPAPLCFRVLIDRCGKVAQEVESEFPGYRAAGLLPVVLNRKRLGSNGA